MLFNTNTKVNKLIVVIFSLSIIGLSLIIDIDAKGTQEVDESLENAVKVFAVAKGLNAAISLAQGTELTPAGQITITVGEVLDPINDMVEQFSWIMLASITSLGIQKILLNFVTGDIFTFLVIVSLIIVNIWMFSRFSNDTKLRGIFFKATIVLVFLRFSIPIMSLLNGYVYDTYVKKDYNIEQSQILIEKSADDINSITNKTIVEKEAIIPPTTRTKDIVSSLVDRTKEFYNSTIDTISNAFDINYYKSKIAQYKEATEKTSDDIINLIIAFTFKTMFFPLVFLFLLYQLLKSIFRIGQ